MAVILRLINVEYVCINLKKFCSLRFSNFSLISSITVSTMTKSVARTGTVANNREKQITGEDSRYRRRYCYTAAVIWNSCRSLREPINLSPRVAGVETVARHLRVSDYLGTVLSVDRMQLCCHDQ